MIGLILFPPARTTWPETATSKTADCSAIMDSRLALTKSLISSILSSASLSSMEPHKGRFNEWRATVADNCRRRDCQGEDCFEILICPEIGDGVSTHAQKFIDSSPDGLDHCKACSAS